MNEDSGLLGCCAMLAGKYLIGISEEMLIGDLNKMIGFITN
jgi:hypothetical protein